MLIGIDGNEANVGKRVGIGEYAFELLKQFKELQAQSFKSCLAADRFQIYLKDGPREDLPKETESWKYRVIGPRKFWTQFGLPLDLYLHRPKPDVFFSPSHYAPRFSPVPTVISVMDLSYVHFPELFTKPDLYQLTNWTKYSAKNAQKIFTISEFSKRDIIKTYGRKPEDVVVTYPGIRQTLNMENLRKKIGIKGKYILFVGTLQPRKNIARLIEAFSKLKEKDLSLLVVGKRGWLYEEILSAPKKFAVDDRVKFLDLVSDNDLKTLYENALCFVLPSLYEGFGLPVLEAMKYGCPVIISNVSSLPEAGGDAALYVDPLNVDDIRKNLELIINDSKLREKLIKKGFEQVKKFSWEKTAKKTLKVLEEIANE